MSDLIVARRHWDRTVDGWASREPTDAERKKQIIMHRWNHGEIDYKEVLKQLKQRNLPMGDSE